MPGSSKFQEQMNDLDEEEEEKLGAKEEDSLKVKPPKKLKRKLKLIQISKESGDSIEGNHE